MAKVKSIYACTACGYEAPRWVGRCPGCGAWNTLEESIAALPEKAVAGGTKLAANQRPGTGAAPLLLRDIPEDTTLRSPTGISELDRVLGGGIVEGGLMLLGGDPSMELEVTGDLGVLFEGVVEGGEALVAVVGDLGSLGNRLERHAAVGSVEVELGVLGALERPAILGTVDLEVVVVGVHDLEAHGRSHLPAVADVLEVALEELVEVVDVLPVVGVRPLVVAVDAQPLLAGAHLAVAVEGAAQVQVQPAGGHVCGAADLLEVGNLGLPVGVHQRVLLEVAAEVLDVAGGADLGQNHVGKAGPGDAALADELAVDVGRALPRSDGRQVGRIVGGGTPLGHGIPGGAAHGDLAAAPGHLRQGLHLMVHLDTQGLEEAGHVFLPQAALGVDAQHLQQVAQMGSVGQREAEVAPEMHQIGSPNGTRPLFTEVARKLLKALSDIGGDETLLLDVLRSP